MSGRRNRLAGSPGSSVVEWIARLAARRSRLVVGVWVVLVVVLAFLGRGIESKLSGHAILINGTESKRAHEIAVREFGNDYSMIVMLRGPQAAVEAQGRTLAGRLAAIPGDLVVSPWGPGSAPVAGLSPRPGVGALLVRVRGSESDQISGLLPPVQRRVDTSVASPVHASLAGLPVLVDSIKKSSAETSAIGELIAVPVLLLVLLFVFRSVLAAVIPLVIGGAVVGATRGVVTLLLGTLQFDFRAIGTLEMMGLALGVDYSLLVVSRFREEREKAANGDIAEAAEATVRATVRSILPAGGALLLAMVLSQFVLPPSFVRVATVPIIIVTLLSMVSAICVVPAVLKILGNSLDRWSLPARNTSRIGPLRWSRRLAQRPGAVAAIVVGLLVLAGLAFNLDSGVGNISILPAGDPGRVQQEEVERGLGTGWTAPMEVIVDGRGSPITSPQRLRAIAAFQRQVEGDPGVASMTGLSRVEHSTRKLTGIEGELEAQESGLDRLESGIARIGAGARKASVGLGKAANGSKQLESGLGAANTGSGALAGALQQTSTGSGRLAQGLGRASEGSGQLAEGTTKVSSGAGRLAEGMREAEEKTGEIQGTARLFKSAMLSGNARLSALRDPLEKTEEQLGVARQALQRMTSGRTDPEYGAVLAAIEEASRRLSGKDPGTGEPSDPAYQGVSAGVSGAEGQFGVGLYLAGTLDKSGRQATKGITKLAHGSERLDQGLRRLAAGSRQVSNGVAALAKGSQQLSPALQRLSQGAERLTGGLGLLETGAGRLTNGLGEGAVKSKRLPEVLQRIGNGLESGRGGSSGETGLKQLQRKSPGLFHSSYFVLASLAGAPPGQRAQLGSLININRGGKDARLLVIPRDELTTSGARETTERLEGDAEGLARKTGTEVVVGGITPAGVDINRALRAQAPLMRLALSLISLIVLIPLLRSLTVPILAALINLVTVSAAFGVLSLLFNGSLLGGPGYIDTTVVPAIIIVMFGLAIDYEVFVFARIREEYIRTGSTSLAVSKGLDRTGHVVTGAAVIMISIFLAFSISPLITIRNFGVAQAVAVFIDAFIVRLVVVPWMMNRLGKWSWWLPGWLDRLLPGSSVVAGEADGHEASA
jgi:RND superfamily putative drug exporter